MLKEHLPKMKLTAVYLPYDEGGYSAFIEEIPGVNSQGEALEEAKLRNVSRITSQTNHPSCHDLVAFFNHKKLKIALLFLAFCSIRTRQPHINLGLSLGSYSGHVPKLNGSTGTYTRSSPYNGRKKSVKI